MQLQGKWPFKENITRFCRMNYRRQSMYQERKYYRGLYGMQIDHFVVPQRSWVQIPCGPEFFLLVFIAARIAYICFLTAVHIYDFHIFPIIIHHLEGLSGSNIITSSQLAC